MLTAAKRTQAGAILIDNTAAHIVAENLIAALFYAMQNEACEVSGTLDHLAQVKADAGRAGWLACIDWLIENSSADLFTDGEAEVARDIGKQYAEQIRKAGA
jgi:hypothetical protein